MSTVKPEAESKTTTPSWASPEDFNEEDKVKGNWVRWGKPGNGFKGVLVEKRKVKSSINGKEEMKDAFDFYMLGGEFNNMDKKKNPIDPAVTINEGDLYSVGNGSGVGAQMRNIRLGDVVVMHFEREQPASNKAWNDAKIVNVYLKGHRDDWAVLVGNDAVAESAKEGDGMMPWEKK